MRLGRLPRLACACALLVAAALAESEAARADDSETVARALFDQATRDMDAGLYDKACPALVEVVKLSRGIGSMIKLGKCYEAQGKLASAWASFKEAAEAAGLAHDDRQAAAEAKARELFPRLSRVVVTVSASVAGAAGLTIRRDDVELVKAQWNSDIPVDPGKHVVTASAPGKKPWTGTVEAPPSGGTAILELPVLDDEPAPPAPPVVPTVLPAPPSASSPPPPRTNVPFRAIGVATGAAGLVALGIGTYLGVQVLDARSQPAGVCDPACNAAGNARNSALGQGDASTALFIVGGALVATGVTLWLVAPSTHASSGAAWRIVPAFTPSSGVLAVAGSF